MDLFHHSGGYVVALHAGGDQGVRLGFAGYTEFADGGAAADGAAETAVRRTRPGAPVSTARVRSQASWRFLR